MEKIQWEKIDFVLSCEKIANLLYVAFKKKMFSLIKQSLNEVGNRKIVSSLKSKRDLSSPWLP